MDKFPIVRSIVNVLDDKENILGGGLFALALFVAQWQAINADSRVILLLALVVSGVAVITGINPKGIAAYFGKKYAHEIAGLVSEGINVVEKATKIDIDDTAELAVKALVEKELQGLKVDAETSNRIQSLENKVEALMGINAPKAA